MPRKRVTLRNRGLGILLFNLRLLIGTLRETPFTLMQLFTTPTYEVATRLIIPAEKGALSEIPGPGSMLPAPSIPRGIRNLTGSPLDV